MKKTLLILSGVVLVSGALLTFAGTVSAHGFWGKGGNKGDRLEKKAQVLGLSVEELEDKLETMTFQEIIEEQGLTREELFERKKEIIQEYWTELGLSEEEIEERLEKMQERYENFDGSYSKSRYFRHKNGFGKFNK